MSNEQQEARDKMEQNTTKAIDRLLNNTTSRFNWIKRVMDRLPEAKKYDVEALLEKCSQRCGAHSKDQGRCERR